MGEPVGERFARALAAKDGPTLIDLLAREIDFRGMTPGRFWETTSPTELVDDMMLGRWFGPGDHIDALEAIENDTVADRERVGYRFRITNEDGVHLVEQQAYVGIEDDHIVWLRIMCSGYRPLDAESV